MNEEHEWSFDFDCASLWFSTSPNDVNINLELDLIETDTEISYQKLQFQLPIQFSFTDHCKSIILIC